MLKYAFEKRGITLVTLIITVVIMLILAAVTIGTINGGLFDYAGKARKTEEDDTIQEAIQRAYIMAQEESETNTVSEEAFQRYINKTLGDWGAVASKNGEVFEVLVNGKKFTIEKNGKTTGLGKITLQNPGDITKGGTCTGSQSDPYKIECIEDLVALAKNVNSGTDYSNKYFVLVNTLDFNSIFSYANFQAKYSYDSTIPAYVPDENSENTIMELCTTGQGFIPIGLSQTKCFYAKQFDGKYENEEHEIRNIYIKGSGRHAGLFGYTTDITIKNLGVTGEITALTAGYRAGGIAGYVHDDTTIENCYNKANIKSQQYAGGIIGQGMANGIIVRKSYNTGTVICEGRSAGGIIGYGSILMEDCYNAGDVTSSLPVNPDSNYNPSYSVAGGLAGSDSSCNRCYNTGDVKGKGSYGILSGNSGSSYIINCYNTGNVTTKDTGAANGIGRSVASIKNTYNIGEITSNGVISGIGFSVPIITNCCSIGRLYKTGYGSKAIICESGTLTNCFYLDGIEANASITPEASITSFIKTSDNPDAMTTAKVVTALNNYIENPPEGETTTGWCKWVVGDNNLPALDFKTEWNGTTWVTVND